MRVWERGVGEKMPAEPVLVPVVAATLTKQCNGKVTVKLNGGTLESNLIKKPTKSKWKALLNFYSNQKLLYSEY